ncbi:MAG: carbon-nitrogen family hydrolase [Kangiellaceae bacterium]
MKVASIQLNIKWHDKQANLLRAKEFIERAANAGCELVVLPEMFNSGYSMSHQEIAEPLEGESVLFLCSLAKDCRINIVGGIAINNEKRASSDASNAKLQPENIAFFINHNGELISHYCKNYPFTLAGEKEAYATGDKQVVFSLGEFRATTFICYDLRFPELFRQVAKQVDLMIVIASWPSTRQHHWELLLQARAIENQCFLIGVNRIGSDANQLDYSGGSLVCDPMGEILSRGDAKSEYLETQIDLAQSAATRAAFPFLNDMKSS